jgi:hypothetical protein
MSIRRFENTFYIQASHTRAKVGGFMKRRCFDTINKIPELTRFTRVWFENAISKRRFLFGTSNPASS